VPPSKGVEPAASGRAALPAARARRAIAAWLGLVALAALRVPIDAAAATCGDERLEAPEACDLGAANGLPGVCCAGDCTPVPAGTSCDDGNPCTLDDRCDAGTCAGAPPACGDGVRTACEVCDDGAANGSVDSCCAVDCRPRSFGDACAGDGDVCSHDVCDDWGRCVHLVEPDPACRPSAPGGLLRVSTARDGAGTSIQLRWRGPALAPELIDDLPAGGIRLCLYDQRGGMYALVHTAVASAGSAAIWSRSGLGWRFSDRTAVPGGIEKLLIRRSTAPVPSRVDLWSREAAASLLPFESRRRVVAQLHAGAACWGASFAVADRNDVDRFVARSEAATLEDRNGNGVREWMMVGDSNTAFLPCAYPHQLALRHPGVVVWNAGLFGSSARGWLRDGTLASLLETHEPDAVLIALGTNDCRGRTAPEIVADLQTLHRQVVIHSLPNGAHPLGYVATIPRIYGSTAAIDGTILEVNAALRESMRGALVDFDSWMPPTWDPSTMWWPGDGVHLGCGGHARRADVLDVLTGD
jgi:hypothetical protein